MRKIADSTIETPLAKPSKNRASRKKLPKRLTRHLWKFICKSAVRNTIVLPSLKLLALHIAIPTKPASIPAGSTLNQKSRPHTMSSTKWKEK